jgi:acetyl-CoA carboxylase biotin carboxyl carrier protein|tara:strand:+ start:138 stop:563 length:426 start_codon:yes stop_codon:yes gene_type:complete
MKIDKKLIKELVENLKEFNLTELEYQDGNTKIKVSKASRVMEQSKTGAVVSPNKAVLNNSDDADGVRVKSPIIGTAYLAPEPGAKKFVSIGDKVKKGQTVMIVEAMKTMNHVPSTNDGVVKKILVEDGQPVEFGQTLVILK